MFKELDEKYRYKTVKYKGCDQYQCNYGERSTALFLEGFGSKSFNSVCFEVV